MVDTSARGGFPQCSQVLTALEHGHDHERKKTHTTSHLHSVLVPQHKVHRNARVQPLSSTAATALLPKKMFVDRRIDLQENDTASKQKPIPPPSQAPPSLPPSLPPSFPFIFFAFFFGQHMIIGGLPLLLLSAQQQDPALTGHLGDLSPSDWTSLLYTSLFGSAVSYGVFFYNASKGRRKCCHLVAT